MTSRSAVGRSRFVRGSGGRGAEPRSAIGDGPPAAPAPAATSAPAGAVPSRAVPRRATAHPGARRHSDRCRYRQGEYALRGPGASGCPGAAVWRGSGSGSTGAFVWQRRTGPGRVSWAGSAGPGQLGRGRRAGAAPPPRCCLFRHRRIKPRACAPLPLVAPGWKAAVTSPHFHMTLRRHEAPPSPPRNVLPRPRTAPARRRHLPAGSPTPPGGVTAPCLGSAGGLSVRGLFVGKWRPSGGVGGGARRCVIPAAPRRCRARVPAASRVAARAPCPPGSGLCAAAVTAAARGPRAPSCCGTRCSAGLRSSRSRCLFVSLFFPKNKCYYF